MKYRAEILIVATDGHMEITTSFGNMPPEQVIELASDVQDDMETVKQRALQQITARNEAGRAAEKRAAHGSK